MKVELCSFSGHKIYPGHGKLFVRQDAKIFRFGSKKSAKYFAQRKNPRKMAWTMFYRVAHKRNSAEEVARKRTRRTVKTERAFVGATLESITAQRIKAAEQRAAVRDQATKASADSSAAKKAAEQKAQKANKSAKSNPEAIAAAKAARAEQQRNQQRSSARASHAPKVNATSR